MNRIDLASLGWPPYLWREIYRLFITPFNCVRMRICNTKRGRMYHEKNKKKEGILTMAITVNWGMMGLFSVVAFLVGWFIFGLLGAVILAIIVMVVMGIIQFR